MEVQISYLSTRHGHNLYTITPRGNVFTTVPDLVKLKRYVYGSIDISKETYFPMLGDVLEYDESVDEWFIIHEIDDGVRI